MAIQVKRYLTIDSFLEDNLSFLEKQEAINNLLIGIPMSMRGEKEKVAPPNLFSVFKNSEVIFSCVQTSPKNFLIHGEMPLSIEAIDALTPVLAEHKIQAEGVIGPKDLSIAFAEAWKQQTGQDWRVNFQQLVYQLDTLKTIKLSSGKLRKANLDDLIIVADWFFSFSKEAMSLASNRAELTAIVQAKIVSGTLYLWEDKEIVSMAAVARPTRNGITVNYVFTPIEHRGKGYASSCVAMMSQLMLEQYSFCCLFTDKSNPTSNRIYQNMGYYPIAEFRELRFIVN